MKLIAANWKMNPETVGEARKLASRIEHGLPAISGSAEVAICAPFIFLPALKHALHHVRLGAQNVSAQEKGPFTGEVSTVQLGHLGVRYVIAGHSERRDLGEDDKFINQKIRLLAQHKIRPILCVGYGTTKSMSAAAVKKLVAKQLTAALRGAQFEQGGLTIAYEPVWAISKGPGKAVAVNPGHAAEICGFIKKKKPQARVIYGGSVTAINAPQLAGSNEIEGALPGGASLKAEEFLKIIKAFATQN